MKLKKPALVSNWRSMWKSATVQLAAAGTAVTSFLISDPNASQALWNAIPAVIQSQVPPQYMPMIGVAIFALSIPARIVKQNNLNKGESNND